MTFKVYLAALLVLLPGCTANSWIDQDCDNLGVVSTRSVGDKFQVTCSFSTSMLNSDYAVQFYRNKLCLEDSKVFLDTSSGFAYPMTNNATELNEYLEATGRYSVEMTAESSDFVDYTLTITGVQEEDFGSIGCQVNDSSEAAFEKRDIVATLQVEGPSLGTHFYVSEFCSNPTYDSHPACAAVNKSEQVELTSGGEFTFHSGEPCKIAFRMKYSNEMPQKVELYIADDENTASHILDLPTRDKPTSQHTNIVTTNGPTMSMNVTGTFLATQFIPKHTYNNKTVYARVTRSLFPVEVLTVVEALNVTFKPTGVSCSTATDGSGPTKSLTISCQVLANPPVLEGHWSLDEATIDASRKHQIENEIDNTTLSSLTIRNVTDEDFGEYRVKFENVYGIVVAHTKVDDEVVGNGSGRSVSMSGIPLILLSVLALLITVVETEC